MGLFLMRLGFSLLFAAAGVWALTMARDAYVLRRAAKLRGIVVAGRVVAFEKKTPTGDTVRGPYTAPVVAFTTRDGIPVRFTSRQYLRPNPYVLGQHVDVRYLADDPRAADVDGVATGWFAIVALVVMLATCFAIAAVPWILGPPSS